MKRYPGIRSFTAKDQHLFKGREAESRELFQLIVLNNIVVLFGKSGIGKTSLLQAGVCPELEDRNLLPVTIRLNQTHLRPEEQFYQYLKEGEYIPQDTPADLTLWEYLKKFWYVDLGEVFKPVIILDQFEELFTLYQAHERLAFIEQLANVINGRCPESLKNQSRTDGIETPPEVKFVIAIRSDYLYLLDELSANIPAILRTRFHLQALDRDNATQAISLPASLTGNFASPPFKFSEQAIDNIIQTLGREENDQLKTDLFSGEPQIEAFQLQLFCGNIENKIIDEKQPEQFLVKPAYYGGAQGIQSIISQFYENAIQKIAYALQTNVEKLLATGLIRNERRIILEESLIQEEYQLSKKELESLHEARILNREVRKGNFYYEISHDTLIQPILKKYQAIALREEQERIEAERLAREKELEIERRKRRKTRNLAIAGFSLAAIAIVAMLLAWMQSRALNLANIEVNRQAYEAQIQIATTKKIEGNYDEALEQLEAAVPFASKLEANTNARLDQLREQWKEVRILVQKGDSLSANAAFNLAIPFYEQAKSVSPDQRIQQLEADAKKQLELRFADLIDKGDEFARANILQLAIENYEKALQLKPDHPETLAKLARLKK